MMPDRILDALFPPRCVLCGLRSGKNRICPRCLDVLPWNNSACTICCQPVFAPSANMICAACQASRPLFTAAQAPLRYAFPIDTALKRMKYRARLEIAPAFAELMLPELTSGFADCDALVPVPLHHWRHTRRGFNQAIELCGPLVRATGLPIVHATRIRRTRSQSGLSAAQRRRNLRRAFEVRDSLRCRYPLIVDDVMTTGATCNELSAALLATGAERVGVLTVARASTS